MSPIQEPGRTLGGEAAQQRQEREGCDRPDLDAIIIALEAASLNPELPRFSVGVLQT